MMYSGPMKRFYKYGISPLRKRFLEQFKKNGEVPVIASLNYLIDEYLTDTQINQIEMLTDTSQTYTLVKYLREQEVLEAAMLFQLP